MLVVAAQVFGAGFLRGALGVTEGRPFEVRDVLEHRRARRIVATSLVIAAGTFRGVAALLSPRASRSPSSPSGACTSSSTRVWARSRRSGPASAWSTSRLTESLVWFLVAGLVVAAGAALCGVGLLVALPVVLLGGAYTYRVLTGQAVVSSTPRAT